MKRLAWMLPAAMLTVLPPKTCQAQEIVPNTITPPLSFCFGKTSHCVLPDLNLSTISYDLVLKKWDGAVSTVGIGYMLLFYSTEPWASGLAAHVAGHFGQSGPNYLAVTPTIIVARYIEIGFTLKLADGSIGRSITLGLGAGLDLLTGRTMATRLSETRASAKNTTPVRYPP